MEPANRIKAAVGRLVEKALGRPADPSAELASGPYADLVRRWGALVPDDLLPRFPALLAGELGETITQWVADVKVGFSTLPRSLTPDGMRKILEALLLGPWLICATCRICKLWRPRLIEVNRGGELVRERVLDDCPACGWSGARLYPRALYARRREWFWSLRQAEEGGAGDVAEDGPR